MSSAKVSSSESRFPRLNAIILSDDPKEISFFLAKSIYNVAAIPLDKSRKVAQELKILAAFVHLLLANSRPSTNSLFLALTYVQRLAKAAPHLQWNTLDTKCRVFQTAMMLADIHLNDRSYSTEGWEQISGIPRHQIVQCKRDFLALIDWDMGVCTREFDLFCQRLEKQL